MKTVDHSLLIGYVGRDPEIREFEGGGKIAQFSIASERSCKNKKTGDWDRKTTWIPVKVRNEKTIDFIKDKIKKGSLIQVRGYHDSDTYETKDGRKVTTLYILAEVIDLFWNPDTKNVEVDTNRNIGPSRDFKFNDEKKEEDDDLPF